MKKILLVAAVGAAIVTACQPANHSNKSPEITLGPNDSLFHVNQGVFQFSIALPKDLMINYSPEIALNESTGELRISLGERFRLMVSEDKKDLAQLEEMLKNDDLFTNKIMEEDANSIMYQQVLPTGETYCYQYAKIVMGDGKSYLVQTAKDGEYTFENVARMKQAANTISALHG